MRSWHYLSAKRLATTLTVLAMGCGGAGFESAEEIKGLRVLAVQKEPAYPAPGEEVNLKLLYWDGKEATAGQRKVNIDFFPPCFNPPGDLYYNCYQELQPGGGAPRDSGAGAGATNDASTEGGADDAGDASTQGNNSDASDAGAQSDAGSAGDAGTEGDAGDTSTASDAGTEGDANTASDTGTAGDAGVDGSAEAGPPSLESDHIKTFHFRVPSLNENARILHPPVADTAQYGLAYVLFTACAGRLGLAPATSTTGLPLACFGDDGKPLGPTDFVPGYTSLYLFDSNKPGCTADNRDCAKNANPVIDELLFGAEHLAKDNSQVITLPRCKRDACPEVEIKPVMDPKIAEIDPSAKNTDGTSLKEQLWVAYYATRGSLSKALRLVNDATTGWSPNYGTQFRPPAEPGPLKVWAVVHDNRGGVEWIEASVNITE